MLTRSVSQTSDRRPSESVWVMGGWSGRNGRQPERETERGGGELRQVELAIPARIEHEVEPSLVGLLYSVKAPCSSV